MSFDPIVQEVQSRNHVFRLLAPVEEISQEKYYDANYSNWDALVDQILNDVAS